MVTIHCTIQRSPQHSPFNYYVIPYFEPTLPHCHVHYMSDRMSISVHPSVCVLYVCLCVVSVCVCVCVVFVHVSVCVSCVCYLCVYVCVRAFACFLYVCFPVYVCINLINMCVVKKPLYNPKVLTIPLCVCGQVYEKHTIQYMQKKKRIPS